MLFFKLDNFIFYIFFFILVCLLFFYPFGWYLTRNNMFRNCDDISHKGKILGNLIIKGVEKYGLWNALRKEYIRSANSSLGRWYLSPI